MHEIGVLYETVKIVEKAAEENHIEQIAAVTLDVGELTGYLPVFFEQYYPVITEGKELFRNSRLIVNTVKGEALCEKCSTLYNVMKHEGCCPLCHSREKKIIGGQEFMIKNIMVAEDTDRQKSR